MTRNRGEEEYSALSAAFETHQPPCTDKSEFIKDTTEYTPDEVTNLRVTVCNKCPLRDLCHAYATKAKPAAGIWAGRIYKPRSTKTN